MKRKRSTGESVPTVLGAALDAKVPLIVWCKAYRHRAEPVVAAQVARDGGDTAVIDWARRPHCTACDGSEVEFVIVRATR